MNNLSSLSLKESTKGLKEKKFSALELTKACLGQIKKVEVKVNAFVTICENEALEEANKADKKRLNGSNLPLLGVPIAIKDNFSTSGIKTTASSKVLENYIPPYDATVIKKLKEAGVIIIGKTNMDAWAHGSSTETSDFGATKNPWNTNHLPGGSSGGSAASVAANEAVAAIGSETAGSIRQPASWCGVVGLKPTYGRVSRYGLIAMASSLDSPGPITKTVEDSALILEVLAGRDEMDASTSPLPVGDYSQNLETDIKKLRIGISDSYFIAGIDQEVETSVRNAIGKLESLGAKIETIKLFDPKYAIDVYTIIQRSEVSSNLARYDGIRYGNERDFFGEEAKRRIMLGTYVLSAGYYDTYHLKAQKVRSLIIQDFNEAFSKVDAIIAPVSPTAAFKLGEKTSDPLKMYLADILTAPANLAGIPGLAVPNGKNKQGLPLGFQLIGPKFSEPVLFELGKLYERF